MSEGNLNRDFGRVEARMDALEADMRETRTDVRCIRKTLDEARGGWKTLMLVAGVAGSIGALAAKVLPWLGMAKP